MTKPKKRKKRRAYPPKYREERAALIHKTRPWENCTGPRSPEGKARASQNATRHGRRSANMVRLRKVLYKQRLFIKALLENIEVK